MPVDTAPPAEQRPASGLPRDRVSARDELIAEFNHAVRRAVTMADLVAVSGLLDRLAAGDPDRRDAVWIPDTNARLAPSALLRGAFPDSDVSLIASQYGEDAHRRGWLRPDRVLTAAEHARLVADACDWARTDRHLAEVLAAFGPPSVVFGDPDPGLPKTLGYATDDADAPLVAFHLGTVDAGATDVGAAAGGATDDGAAAGGTADAVLLAVRVRDDFFHGWELTPTGTDRFH